MTAGKKWVAAGSSAAVLAGGLFLGAPAAYAADETCAGQAELLAAAAAVHDTGLRFNSLVPAGSPTRTQLENAQAALATAIVEDSTKGGAEAAWGTIRTLQVNYADATDDPAVDAAAADAAAAADRFQTEAVNSGVTMEDGACLVAMFEGSYGPLVTGIGTGTGTGTPGTGTGTWTGTGTDSGSGVNQGINMQTAEEGGLGSGVLAGLLAAGAALAGAVAFRMRRRHA